MLFSWTMAFDWYPNDKSLALDRSRFSSTRRVSTIFILAASVLVRPRSDLLEVKPRESSCILVIGIIWFSGISLAVSLDSFVDPSYGSTLSLLLMFKFMSV